MRRATALAQAAVLTAVLAGLALSGCGEKIAIPEPVGTFSIAGYLRDLQWRDPGEPRQLVASQKALFVLTADSLTQRNLEYGRVAAVGGFQDPTALAVDRTGAWLFVLDQAGSRLSWFNREGLVKAGEALLPEVVFGTALVTNPAGIDQVPGAHTFVYVSDPQGGAVRRYAFDEYGGLTAWGLLARSGGAAARFVNQPAGMATDRDDSLLICDADSARNWVIRFNAEPDLGDDDLRGRAALFGPSAVCPTAAADEYTLGNAATCDQTDWVGGPSSEQGEFDRPLDVAVDGSGAIYVADTENERIQIFSAVGEYDFLYVIPAKEGEDAHRPVSMAVLDEVIGTGTTNYGAWIFFVSPDNGMVVRLISRAQYQEEYREPPPDDLE